MIIIVDKKEIDIFKESCAALCLSFKEYTTETNELTVTGEIMIDGTYPPLEPSPATCLFLGRQVQMNWQKEFDKKYSTK